MYENCNKIDVEYNEINNIKLENGKTTYLVVKRNNVKFEFLLRPKEKCDEAIIFGTGAYDYRKKKLPIFQRVTWIDEFEQNIIYFNDPTLYLGKINLGWGYGTDCEFYLEIIADILRKILGIIGVSNKNTIIYGNSSAGYMAMILATVLKDSKAIINNPQTDISRYHRNIVFNVFKVIYPNMNLEQALSRHPDRINVAKYFERNGYIPSVKYLQNISNNYDVQTQLIPFIEDMRTVDQKNWKDKIEIQIYIDKSEKLGPLSKKETIELIRSVCKKKLNYIRDYNEKINLYSDNLDESTIDNIGLNKEYDNCLEIRSEGWQEFSKRQGYRIYRYDANLDKKKIKNNYLIKINGKRLNNVSADDITLEGCCDIYVNGYIYVSISEDIFKENQDIKEYFKKSIVKVYYQLN